MQNAFENLGMVVNGMLFLSPREALEASEKGAVFVDIREDYETGYKAFAVEEVIYLPFHSFKDRVSELPADKYFVVADSVGNKLRQAIDILSGQGFKNIAGLNGGIFDWERDGLPMKFDRQESLTGSCTCTLKPRKNFSSRN
ncbi:MAG: rhodanese-like domain-containing protein [Marinilabiliales bacterium]|nr:MAG: rhodanese-like domain-containing protein [Marinilabiliales bacterium]